MPRKKKQLEQTAEEKETGQSWKMIQVLGADNKLIQLGTIISETDIFPFEVKRGGATITKYKISYDALKKIAKVTGLQSYDFSLIMPPDSSNMMTTYLSVTVHCTYSNPLNEKVCIHGFLHGETTKLGEANSENTKSISARYKGVMAEKRGFERAVIEHLGLPNIYGESEFAEEETQHEAKPEPKKDPLTMMDPTEFKAINKLVQTLIDAKTVDELEVLAESINAQKETLNDKQLMYLRAKYQKVYEQLTESAKAKSSDRQAPGIDAEAVPELS